MNIKVGVRVRPFSYRQKQMNSDLCVDMMGQITRIIDPNNPESPKDFIFDYNFWSHQGFNSNLQGTLIPNNETYAGQIQVYQSVCEDMIQKLLQGYNCNIIAYGQTGAGKTYTLSGIITQFCRNLFNKMQEIKSQQYLVNLSMIQIYNERIQDLLVPLNMRLKDGYRIREHKRLGIYIEGLSKNQIKSFQQICGKMQQGKKNKSIAATMMSACSSRSHTIYTIQIKHILPNLSYTRSTINFVDLAGSERIHKTGVTGDRLREASAIGKSLNVLGVVISVLADKSMGIAKNQHVPYRDSCLTRVLQSSLSGNSNTTFLCMVSPAAQYYDESLSTLRFGSRARVVQNKPIINKYSENQQKIQIHQKQSPTKQIKQNMDYSGYKNQILIVKLEESQSKSEQKEKEKKKQKQKQKQEQDIV